MANPQDTTSAHHHAVWGSLTAKLEADCEEVLRGPTVVNSSSFRVVSHGSNNVVGSGTKASGGNNGPQLSSNYKLNSNEVSLKQWMAAALSSTSITSSNYINNALKIAAALAKELNDAANVGYGDKLEALRGEGDWIARVVVRLDEQLRNNGGGQQVFVSPTPSVTNNIISSSTPNSISNNNQEQDMNQQLEAFLESFGVDDFEKAEAQKNNGGRETAFSVISEGDEWLSRPLPKVPSSSEVKQVKIQDVDSQMDDFLKSVCLDVGDSAAGKDYGGLCLLSSSPGLDASVTTQGTVQDRNYMNVESAEIRPSRGYGSNYTSGSSATEERRRIFRLGMLFYTIFSGGRSPPSEIAELGSSRGAFVSLPQLSLSDTCRGKHYGYQQHKRRVSTESSSVRSMLKQMGLPGPLCNLIGNMLDVDHEELSEDAYTKMTDVKSDLELMLKKPHKFLKDLDLGKLSLQGFKLKDTEFSREKELETMRNCYERSTTGSYEVGIIAGLSGTGKSWLAERVGRFVVARGGLFLTGKFDQMQVVTPFSVLASVFDQYCDVLVRESRSQWARNVACKLAQALGHDACYLVKIIPKLSMILPGSPNASELGMDSSMHTLQRLCYLLCQFVEVISNDSPVSVTLCLDDVQWCDEATILVLNQLLIKQSQKFFFVGCLRIDEMNDDHPFWRMIQNVKSFGVNTTAVKLDCMDRDTLNDLVSDLLCLPPRKVRALSDMIFTKTIGCPLFFSQLMLSLNRDGLLRPSLSKQRWVWDHEEILCMKLPENVAVCVTDGIRKLPIDVQVAIRTLSLFGASARCDYMKALQSQLNLNLTVPLTMAASEGILTNIKGSYHFSHDRIQEAVYGNIDEGARRRDHSLYGLCLVKSALESGNDDMLFVAVNQINLGGPSAVLEQAELAAMTKYNLIAGKAAIKLSDFSSACSFFMNALQFLPENHWYEHYHLSLELFEMACKSALATGNIQSLQVLSAEVLKHAKSFEDKLGVYCTVLSSLVQSSMVLEALEMSREILSRLGEGIPSTISHDALVQYTHQTQSMIRGITENDFLSYKLMTDSNKLTAMKFLAKTESITPMVKPDLHHYVTMKMVQLTITHGLSPMTPIAFAYFGAMLAKRGNIKVGYRFTLLAKALLDKLDSRKVAGEVMSVVAEAQSYVQPIQALSELWVKGEHTALAAGDTHFACINRVQHCSMLFWTGVKLSTVREEFAKAIQFMKEQSHTTSLFLMQTLQNTMLALAGSEGQTDNSRPTSIAHERMILSFQKLYTAFILNSQDLRQCVEKFLGLKELSLFLISGDAFQIFIVGLACYQLYHETRDALWAERGRKCKEKMKIWSQQGSPWNFEHKALLLEAEGQYCCGNFEGAKETYKQAIQSAQSHKFLNDEALARELTANFYRETGDSIASMEHYTQAHKKYCDWGACSKAAKLFERIINEN